MQLADFFQKLKGSQSLRARATRGGFWIGIGSGSEQAFRLLRNMILTRILAPEAFGIMAIVLAVNAAFESFTQLGIKEAIVQNKKGHERAFLNGAWWFSSIRAVALYALVFISAPFVAQFYEKPELHSILRFSFLTLLLNGVMSSEAYVLVKKLKFQKWVIIFYGGSLCGIVSAVVLAFFLQNVWALVIGFVVEAAARFILSYILCPFLPGFTFEKDSMRSLLKFARGMLGLPILTFIFMRTDIFVVGKLLPMTELGLYAMARAVARVPCQFISSLIGQITMPAFSERQTDKEWINKWILNITSLVLYLGLPMLFFAAFYGQDILTLIYGSQYGTVALPFAIIFAAELIRASAVAIVNIFLASGRPELHRRFTMVRAILILVLIIPLVKLFGLTGAAVSVLIALLTGYFFQVRRLSTLTGLKAKQYVRTYVSPACVSACVLLVWFATKDIVLSTPIINIIPGLIGCLCAYGIAAFFFIKNKQGSPSLFTMPKQ